MPPVFSVPSIISVSAVISVISSFSSAIFSAVSVSVSFSCISAPFSSIGCSSVTSVPVTLREEYRYAETKTLFPVFQDSPLTVNLNGEQASGLYASVVEEVETNLFSGEESRKLLIQSKGPELLARAGKLDFSMELSQEKENPKAGEIVYYHVLLCNTGEREIENLVLQEYSLLFFPL